MAEFQRGLNIPHEGFVQGVIQKYFNEQGYLQIKEGYSAGLLEKKW
jgi:hypothetical protein